MRRWMAGMLAVILFPWVVSLIWSQAAGKTEPAGAGQAGDPLVMENEAARTEVSGNQEAGTGAANGAALDVAASVQAADQPKKVLVERDGVRTYMELEDYLPGVIVCQIDPEAELEALKCQAVIARTYICRLMDGRSEIEEQELDLDYLEAGQKNRKWDKEKTIRNLERCAQAAAETEGVVMTCEDREILPLFHASNAGRTRDGDTDSPYLQSVESRWDALDPQNRCTVEFGSQELADKINQIPDAAAVSADQLPSQIQTVKKDSAGYVLQIKIGAGTYTGEEVQYALGLDSACFSFDGGEHKIAVTVKGSGHGYGLSQAGARAMAAEGGGYEDILNYYYKNISLISE